MYQISVIKIIQNSSSVGKAATMLQEAQLKIVPHTKCQEQFSKVKGALINEKVLCAAENGKDTCQVQISKVSHVL